MTPIAVLPMYDRPELRQATDALWHGIRDELRSAGIDAPDELERDNDPYQAWRDPALVLGQTCGLPYRRHLHPDVQLVGAPDYGLEACAAGYYRSLWIVQADDPRSHLSAFADGRFAFNSRDSQSGYAAAIDAVGRPFAMEIETGAHVESLRAVAAGSADIAAIDAVTWRLAQRFEACVSALRVLGRTPATPGLPLITSQRFELETVRIAAARGIAKLDPAGRRELGIRGLVSFRPADYGA